MKGRETAFGQFGQRSVSGGQRETGKRSRRGRQKHGARDLAVQSRALKARLQQKAASRPHKMMEYTQHVNDTTVKAIQDYRSRHFH
jgi:hypothetical protein